MDFSSRISSRFSPYFIFEYENLKLDYHLSLSLPKTIDNANADAHAIEWETERVKKKTKSP